MPAQVPAVVTLYVREGERVAIPPVTPDHECDHARESGGSGCPVAPPGSLMRTRARADEGRNPILAFMVAVWHAPRSGWKGVRHESSLAGDHSHRTRSVGCQLRPRLSPEDGSGRGLHIERDHRRQGTHRAPAARVRRNGADVE